MKKISKKIITSILLIALILLTFMAGCAKGGRPKNISEDEIYPKGSISKAKVFDASHNEKVISLSKDDAEFIVQTLKDSKKELRSEYEGSMIELNISFTDSIIQMIRKDDETIYYVFHNSKINAICYEVRSKELSQFILKAAS